MWNDSRFGWKWYSVCGIHKRKDPVCLGCSRGWWHSPWSRFKSWYWYKTHVYVNDEWVKRRKVVARITTIEGHTRTGRHPELVSKNSKVGRSRFR